MHRIRIALLLAVIALPAAAGDEAVLFIAGPKSHGWNEHEHPAGCRLLADALNAAGLGIQAAVQEGGWPAPDLLRNRKAVVIFSDGFGSHPAKGHEPELKALAAGGAGIAILHYAVSEDAPALRDALMATIGGCCSADWSVNPIWTMTNAVLAQHPIANGVGPLQIKDEWYYHLHFAEEPGAVTPILTALPPTESLAAEDGPHRANPAVRQALAAGQRQTLAWAFTPKTGGRGIGFTGGHFHPNWMNDDFRKLILNAIVWTAGLPVPASGVASKAPVIVTNKLLTQAIAKGDVDDVQRHIATGAKLNLANETGWTPLHYATVRGHVPIVKRLLAAGANPNAPAKSGQTPLHIAADRGFTAVAEALVDAGANLAARDQNGWTPLHYAAEKDRVEAAACLLRKGAGVNLASVRGGTPLHEASACASAAMIQLLLDHGADRTIKATNGKTALDYAVELDNKPAAALLKK